MRVWFRAGRVGGVGALVLTLAVVLWAGVVTAAGQGFEMAGWQAELETRFHDVAGTVTIVDEHTLQVDGFHYDGTGISVFFWLDEVRDPTEPISFRDGYAIGSQLLRSSPYVDESFTIDLGTASLAGHRAISVWCVPAGVSFGDAVFAPVPEPASAAGLSALGAGWLLRRGRRAR